ncbi:Growth hormone receptor [Dissostichus eleginoides]|uniref:Growth hormone receptor n=1 Tax=Dissostichus eleginoides TaxID=100907 RepID=A0AAD9C145_DISEL|nr:Growth hormone receptor [Dissostichus eleginoides]
MGAIVEPYITECISSNQETFRCWWSQGDFHNLSSPGALKIFYHKKAFGSHWKECPEYIYPNRECFFDRNHTSIWTLYCVELRSQNNITYFNECFNVENIVRPDPPISLNWTLLNVSPSGLSYDVMVNWESPPSADVKAGWMRIEYEIQYREKNSTEWEALEMQPHTKQTIFGLHIGKEYQVHIRCRMPAFIRFGEFSDSIFIQVTKISIKDSTFPLTLVLVFGVVGVLILIMLIVVSQQHRFMMILLPPVPAPKIKGIDPELLKKGKLDELNFILSGGGMGGLPTYAQDFYQDEPWVEFIEVDAEDADTGEKEDNQGSDTQRLLGLCHPASHHMNTGCSNAVSFPDDDSGRASCCDPDLPEQDTLIIQESTSATEEETQKKGKSSEDTEDKRQKELQFQMLMVDPEGSGYTTESIARQISTPPAPPMPGEGYQTIQPQPVETKPAAMAEDNQSPYILPDSSQSQFFAPVADYTVVQEVDSQHSLLLKPPARQSPPPCMPQHPLKALPAMPMGYITPDLLGNLAP